MGGGGADGDGGGGTFRSGDDDNDADGTERERESFNFYPEEVVTTPEWIASLAEKGNNNKLYSSSSSRGG